MKTFSTIILTVFTIFNIYSQEYFDYYINFEDPGQFYRLEIDTISNPNNIWEIGVPNKTIFDSASSEPNVIVTDTINHYPINDTSSFTIKHVSTGEGFELSHTVILQGKYQVNCDSLTDFGKIEFSPDNGITWVDLLNDEEYYNMYCYEWWSEKPTLTGNTSVWTEFRVWVAGFGPVFDIQFGDTVLYKFTFISDELQTNKDGLMFDDFQFEDWAETIETINNPSSLNVYPNPTTNFVTIEFNNTNNELHKLVVYDSNGHEILLKQKTTHNKFEIDLSNFEPETYFYLISNLKNGHVYSGKIVRK
jgi:hypothetical protein